MKNKFNTSVVYPALKLVIGLLGCLSFAVTGLRAQYVSAPISSGLLEPYGVATDPSGNVYVTDASNNRIIKYVPNLGTVSTLAGLAGSGNTGTNNGIGSQARFSQPLGIVYARNGLVVVDQGNQLIRYVSLAGVVTNLAGVTGVYGSVNGPANIAEFSFPTGIAADSVGNLYVADQGNNAIRMISTNNVVSTMSVGSYQFNSPSAVAVDNNNNVWVADTKNEVICMISNQVVYIMAGTYRTRGTNDSLVATEATFNLPSGILWVGENNSLLISDTGSDTIRSLFLTNALGPESYAVQTIAGLAGEPGLVNGTLAMAQFDGPVSLAVDLQDSGYYIVDRAANALRILQPTEPQPPVTSPDFGYITFPVVDGLPAAQFNSITGKSVVFNNSQIIEILADPTVQTFMTYGPTPSNPLDNTIPTPGPATGTSPEVYTATDNGQGPGDIPPSIIGPMPDVTLEAVSQESGRLSSPVVSARIQFVTANPTVTGNNAASVQLVDSTTNAQMWYTLDGSAPMQNGSNSIGPVLTGQTISFLLNSNTTLNVQAYNSGFAPSGIVSALFSPSNFVSDEITFGFATGEASSAFVASAGQRFYAPVTLSLIPTAEIMDSLQFNLGVTNLVGPPMSGFTFQSMLIKPIPGVSPVAYEQIPNAMFNGSTLTNLLLTNDSTGLLEVGWLERQGQTNLYVSTAQTLITYSQAHDTLFLSQGGSVIAGAFSFVVPPNAQAGDAYEIGVGSPSATSDGISTPVFIATITNGSSGAGAVNSVKTVTIGSARYLVGDAAPFRWFNAGDFGDTNLANNDVTEVFQSAVYRFNVPPPGSDYFDAMDSSDGLDNKDYNGDDTDINNLQLGDGYLGVDDVYVTFRRSLDPTLTWYDRYWSGGQRVAVAVPNTLAPVFSAKTSAPSPVNHSKALYTSGGTHFIDVAADQVQGAANSTVQVPVRALAGDTLPIRVMMLNLEVDPLDGSPALTNAVTFTAVTNLGAPAMSDAQQINNYAAAWLDSTVSGVTGTNIIGYLSVTLPGNATTNSSYLVHFDHFSSSPNGIALFQTTVSDGLITVGSRSGSSWHDGIPDSWRLLYFGTVSNMMSAANADADGDGASNWNEYVAGTSPTDGTSVFQFLPGSAASSSFTLQWPSIVNKHYSVQASSTLAPGGWTTVATNIVGNGQNLQWTDPNSSGQGKFYRALVQ